MDLSIINNLTSTYTTSFNNAQKNTTNAVNTANETAIDDTAVVYKKSNLSSSTKVDQATIDRMKADSDQKNAQLASLVSSMLSKQGITFNNASQMYAILRSGNFTVDPAVQAQAEKDISEDGYWGVAQTSERLVSFAKALSGGDTSKADELIDAIKKGFDEATNSWGDTLPDICQETLDATIEKMEAWKNGTE